MRRLAIFFACAAIGSAAHAGDKILYAPAPDWVVAAPAIDATKLDANSPAILILDNQQRLKDGVAWSYVDTASRVATAQALNEMGTITVPWMPDRGDLTIHKAEIIRGSEHIDLLKSGERFAVLRREALMEQLTLTGILSATMSVEGLRVGDVLRIAISITQADPAFKGRVEAVALTPAEPFRAQFARARLLWPADDVMKWKGYADGLKPVEKTVGGFHELTVALPLVKQAEMPGDLPAKYNRLPILEATTFADWADVSRTLAPLYATHGLITPGSPLAAEVAAIAKAETDPLHRAERALELVQDKIRYLAVAMNGGGLKPQTPARTWEVRYGDCKAKTLLLLAILHDLRIEAEATTASIQTGGFVAERLPSIGAFDHVIVRATIGGESLWLDGTGGGARLADIRDTPPFRYVLPLRPAGAGLMPMPIRADARPRRIVDIAYDQSAGIDMPMAFDAKISLRGGFAQMIDSMTAQTNAEQKRDFVRAMVAQEVGQPQISKYAIQYDPVTALATVTASGLVTTPWRRENQRYRMPLDHAVAVINFSPDRGRAAWHDIPIATNGPDSVVYRTRVTLPANMTGFLLEGDQAMPPVLAGRLVRRTASLNGRTVVAEDRIDAIGIEIAPVDLPAERGRYAQAKAKLLRVSAPAAVPSRWENVLAARKDGRFKPLEAAYAAAIAADPEEVTGYASRASFRIGVYDRQGAIADLTKAIALQADAATYRLRGSVYEALGDLPHAIADYEQARALDGSDDTALNALAMAKAYSGDTKAAIALLDDRIAVGDRERYGAIGEKAEILAQIGKPSDGVALVDAAIVERPGDPQLLNSRCWVKGIGAVALESALKDCTKAIELSDYPAAPLDSRALIYFRLARYDDAIADLNAALESSPNLASSLFLRGVTYRRTGKLGEAEADLTAARAIDPQIDATYRRYAIVP